MTGPIKAGLIAVGPVLNTVGFAVTGPETRLTLEMTLPQAELVLARLVRAAASARVAAGTAKWRNHLRGLASLTCFSPRKPLGFAAAIFGTHSGIPSLWSLTHGSI